MTPNMEKQALTLLATLAANNAQMEYVVAGFAELLATHLPNLSPQQRASFQKHSAHLVEQSKLHQADADNFRDSLKQLYG